MACNDCAAFREELRALTALLDAERKLAVFERERANASAEELLSIASTAAQIGYLSQKAFPLGSQVTDEASAVALGALKQIRERLKSEE